MCQAQDAPQRRHRAAYLAPSAGPLQPQIDTHHDNDDQVIPLLVEIPSTTPMSPVSPPSSGELNTHDLIALPVPSLPTRGRLIDSILSCYRGFVDLVLVVAMCLIGCFFYDVDVQVVKSNRRRARERRVIILNEQYGGSRHRRTTSLLRSPSPDGSSSMQHWGFV